MIETADLLLENKTLQEKLLQSESEIFYLKFQLDQLKRQVFGVKSERFLSMLNAGQLALPIENEHPPVIEEEETISVEAHDRKRKKKKENHPVRKPFPAHLPRQIEEIYPEGFDANSPDKPIGKEITEILEEIPGKFYVKHIIRYKFANKETGGVVIGELPSRVNEKGMFGELLQTRIIIDKYCDHIPGYRQEQRFTRAGIKIPYSTLMDVPRQTGNYIVPLYQELKKQSLNCKYLQIDETPHPVLDRETKGKTHCGYLWVYRSVEQRLVLFEYCPGRGQQWPKEILKNYKGFIQTDGYVAYDYFDRRADITSVCCMAHARRYFEKALVDHKDLAEYFITKLQAVYAVEREIRDDNKSDEDILFLRKKKSLPILNELEKWLNDNIHQPPSTPIGNA